MKIAPLIAIIFAFFLIAIYPIYSDNGIDENLSYSDEDNDGIPNDKDKCPEENASGKDIDEDGCIDSEITKEEVDYLERLAKINIGQYIIFAVVSLFSTAIRSILGLGPEVRKSTGPPPAHTVRNQFF